MRLRRTNDIPYFTFNAMDRCPGIVHGVFTRLGGSSKGPFTALNVGMNSGDDPGAVSMNRQAVANCLGQGELFFLSQVHGTGIAEPGDAETGDENAAGGDPPEADAVISDTPGRMLVVQVADCQSVMLYDPDTPAVANIHAGWRGSIGNIIGRCIDAMKDRFGTRPESLVAAIGPSLGPCCAEFVNHENEIPRQFLPYKDDRNRFNFWQVSHDQLTACGVFGQHIEWSNICTRCNTHLFFSYRHEKTTGRFASVIGLPPPDTERK